MTETPEPILDFPGFTAWMLERGNTLNPCPDGCQDKETEHVHLRSPEGHDGIIWADGWLNAEPAACAHYAEVDVEDLRAADTVISFTSDGGGKGGRHTEYGLAIGLAKRLVIVGPREHVFHTLPQVEWYPDWAHLVMAWSPEFAASAP